MVQNRIPQEGEEPCWVGGVISQKQKRVGGSEARASLTVGCLLALLAPGFPQDVHTGNSEQWGGEMSFLSSLVTVRFSQRLYPRHRLGRIAVP